MGRFIIGLLVGMAVGYGMAKLFATEDEEPMTMLGSQADALRERPRQVADATQERIRLAVEEGRRAADAARAELETKALDREGEAELPEPTGDSPL